MGKSQQTVFWKNLPFKKVMTFLPSRIIDFAIPYGYAASLLSESVADYILPPAVTCSRKHVLMKDLPWY